MEIKLPPKFYDDHVDRALPAGTELRRTATYVLVSLTEEDAREILSDALYYSNPVNAKEMGLPGLASSARATAKRLSAVIEAVDESEWLVYVFINPDPDARPITTSALASNETHARRICGRDLPRTATWPLAETRKPRY